MLHLPKTGSRVFFPYDALSGPVRTASALGRLQRCCLAPNTEGDLRLCRALLSMNIGISHHP